MTLFHIPSIVLVRVIVRVHTPEVVEMDLEWILILIKVHIPKVVAVRVLYSSNIEVILFN